MGQSQFNNNIRLGMYKILILTEYMDILLSKSKGYHYQLKKLGETMHTEKINSLEVIMLLLLSLGLLNHVIIIPMLLDSGGRDAWISVLASGILFLLFALLISFIMARTGQENIYLYLKKHYGSFIAWCLITPFCLYLFLSSFITFKDTVTWTITSYLPQSSSILLELLLLSLCIYAAFLGIRVIAVAAGIILPIVVTLGFFVMSANMSKKEFSLLKPVLEFDIEPVAKGMLVACGGFIEIILLLTIQHHLKKRFRWYQVILVALLLIGLTFGPLTAAISEFGPQLAKELRYPAFEQWRLVTLGTYVDHVDYLSIFQWLSGAFIRVSLAFFLLPDLLHIVNQKKRIFVVLGIAFLFLISNFLPISDMALYSTVYKYVLPGQLIILFVTTCIIFLLVVGKKKERRNLHD
ncbi:GerAB/ArcD/ProY family transporter [Mangrovibacillus cuniculi]|uniref:Endospore germination permease n=1 Tax=Mangrovibacillus cuniculi TaxID=2593652 RepID=A0A7S8HGX0_9BACI|nr:endospore germination permease [Mangrovibacillus cuniculi]QPC48232.1 endospore germination permease [Mangrovibacillus cuniculi]